MKKLFRIIGFFFLGLGGFDKKIIKEISWLPAVELELLQYAKVLVKVVETSAAHGTSGEWKRHVAFAALQKKFPSITKRQIAIAIEIALA